MSLVLLLLLLILYLLLLLKIFKIIIIKKFLKQSYLQKMEISFVI